jgi:PAS domain S-box-containing protein
MKPNTALGILLGGVALAILSREKVAAPARFWATLMAAVMVAVGALTLSEYLFGWELGIDQWLFHDADHLVGTSQPGRMSPATAFCMVLTSVALLMESQSFSTRLRLSVLAALGLALIVIGGLAFVGNVSDALFGIRWWSYTGMAVHTAAGFMLFGFGLLALGRSKGEFKWSLDALTTGGFVVGILALLAAAGISYHFTNQLQESAAWVSHTQEVLKEIGGITAGVASIGSSQRSYINTGDARFLEQEAGIKDALHNKIAALRKLTADNPRQQPRLDQLDPLIVQRIDWGEQTIAARRKEGLSAAEQMIATGKGIELTDSIRRLIKALEDEEYSLLDQRQKKERAISDKTFLFLPLGVFLSVTLLSLGLFFLNTGMGERARAEEKSAWLASFPERNPSHIVELDLATGIIHYLNPFTLRLLPDLQSQGLRHPWLAGLQDAATVLLERHGEPLRREIAAGGRFYAQTINYIPETKRVRVYGNDITERKQVESAAARLAAIVEFSDDAIIGKDLQGVVTSWNAGAERLFGYLACEMVGQPIMRLIPPERQQEEEEILSRVKRGENVKHFDTVRVRKDGSMVAISVTVSPIKDSTGMTIGASKVARDITERKLAEAQLKLLETCIGRLNDIVLITEAEPQDEPGPRILFVNDAFVRRTGYTRAEVLGRSPRFLQGPKTTRAELDRIRAAMRQWKPVRAELINYTKSGQEFWLEMDIVPVADATGWFTHWVAVERDITERKQTEEALRASEGRLRLVTDNARVGLVMVNCERQYTFANATYAEILGLPSADLVGQRVADVLAPLYELQIRPHLDRAFAGERVAYELQRPTMDEDRYYTVKYEPTKTGGSVLQVVVVITDITDRKRAEEARRASEARYRMLFDYAPDGIVIVDSKGYYLDANASICRMLGYTRDEFIGLNASDVVAPEEIPHIGQALDVIKTKSDYQREWQFRRKDGSVFAVDTIATAMPDGNLLAMIRDITERKQAQERNSSTQQRIGAARHRAHGATRGRQQGTGSVLLLGLARSARTVARGGRILPGGAGGLRAAVARSVPPGLADHSQRRAENGAID